MTVFFSSEEFEDAADNYLGFCKRCEEFIQDNVEPDAEDYDCDACGEEGTVIGAELALLQGLVDVEEENDS